MEYFVGSLVSLVALFVIVYVSRKSDAPLDITVSLSQSRLHSMISEFGFQSTSANLSIVKPSQASNHYDRQHIRVVVQGDKAYWILDNQFMVADILDGEINKESQRRVDTIAMDAVELGNIMHIVDELGGNDASWNSGK